jgi:hypothetical protein
MKRVAVILVALAALGSASAAGARVLLVGTYKGIHGQYVSIQAAVDAARRGDWILVGPGDYKTTSSRAPAGRSDTPAGVLIATRRVYLRGMNRKTVIVDGTKSGPACSRAKRDQSFGPHGKGGARGLNGIMVWKAADVWVQNLTACNFLSALARKFADVSVGQAAWAAGRSSLWMTRSRSARVNFHSNGAAICS